MTDRGQTFRTANVGAVSSADIAVPEHPRELQFYSRVLTAGESPLWRSDLMNAAGTPIIGLGERIPEYEDLPLQWMLHIQVADVAASAERAVALGGSELRHNRNEAGESQWAVLLDPSGAAFGLVPAPSSSSTEPIQHETPSDSMGRIAWFDLTVSDAPATLKFYQEVVGWSVEEVELEDAEGRYTDYLLSTPGGTEVGGICHARGVNRAVPPVWLIYLPVGDLQESLKRVEEGGGEVLETRTGADGNDVYAVIRDPVGACLALAPGWSH